MQIYKTTNLINNKIYIGQTNGKKKHYIGSGFLLLKAIKKYGKENFKKEILEDGLTLEQANEKEKYYIKLYNSTNHKIGYNIANGGNGTGSVSEKTKKLHSKRIKGKTYEELYGEEKAKKLKEQRSKQLSKKNMIFYLNPDEKEQWKTKIGNTIRGRKASFKCKQKIGDALRGVPKSKEHKRKLSLSKLKVDMKTIINIRKERENGLKYKELSNKYNFNEVKIWRICNEKYKFEKK